MSLSETIQGENPDTLSCQAYEGYRVRNEREGLIPKSPSRKLGLFILWSAIESRSRHVASIPNSPPLQYPTPTFPTRIKKGGRTPFLIPLPTR